MSMRKYAVQMATAIAALACAFGCATATPERAAAAPVCTLSAEDMAWVEDSVAAWRLTRAQFTRLSIDGQRDMILFSADCALTSNDAINADGPITWSASPVDEGVRLPSGNVIPIGVIAFARQVQNGGFFVMSTPSVWRANAIEGGPLGLPALMTAVLIHEATHLAQIDTYMARFAAIAERERLPTDFNDDSIQERFEGNERFAASISRETDLLFAAASADTAEEAHRLAAEARALIAARRAQWYTGPDAALSEIEDVWLTLEGSGQWAGHQWLTSRDGAAAPAPLAMAGFARRGGWWSQTQGLALLLAVDRIAGEAWRAHAFGDGAVSGVEFLDAALAD
jgi:hypothetical protein